MNRGWGLGRWAGSADIHLRRPYGGRPVLGGHNRAAGCKTPPYEYPLPAASGVVT